MLCKEQVHTVGLHSIRLYGQVCFGPVFAFQMVPFMQIQLIALGNQKVIELLYRNRADVSLALKNEMMSLHTGESIIPLENV